jgi:hypothetical protein
MIDAVEYNRFSAGQCGREADAARREPAYWPSPATHDHGKLDCRSRRIALLLTCSRPTAASRREAIGLPLPHRALARRLHRRFA